jgi:hypothetical protein
MRIWHYRLWPVRYEWQQLSWESSKNETLDKPEDSCRIILPDANGIVELAATRLIRESTASRVRDILLVCQQSEVREIHGSDTSAKKGSLPNFVA